MKSKIISESEKRRRPCLPNEPYISIFFSDRRSWPALESMLNETFCMADLDKRISIVSVETQKTYKGQNRFGKEIKVDLIAQCTDAELVNVEFTMQERKTSANRSIYYLCRIIVDSLSRGDDYSCLSSVTQVNFLNYTPRGIKDDRLVNVMRLMDTNKKSRRVSLTIIDVHMNRILISLKTLHDCNDNVLFKCLYFFMQQACYRGGNQDAGSF